MDTDKKKKAFILSGGEIAKKERKPEKECTTKNE